MELTAAKVRPIYEKMFSDTHNRIVDTITLLRGCRLLNFSFVKNMNIEALEEELDFIRRIPMANLIFGALKAELFVYKRVAMEAPPDLSSWGFWVKYCLRLPVWYKVASEGALVVVSSASVERLFSILASQIHDSQSRALSDYQTAAVLLRYNTNSRS